MNTKSRSFKGQPVWLPFVVYLVVVTSKQALKSYTQLSLICIGQSYIPERSSSARAALAVEKAQAEPLKRKIKRLKRMGWLGHLLTCPSSVSETIKVDTKRLAFRAVLMEYLRFFDT